MRVPVILAGVALLSAGVRADTLKVPQEFESIQAAVDEAADGDTVLVSKGTYAPFSVLDKTNLTIRGKGKHSVDGGESLDPVVTVNDSADITLVGLFIENGEGMGIDVMNSDNVTISKCRIEAPDGIGIRLAGHGHVVEKCRIDLTLAEAIVLREDSEDILITKNRMTDTASGVTFLGSNHVATKNRLEGSQNEGFVITASDCLIEKNRFDGIVDDALDVEGDNNTLRKNFAKNVNDNGIEVKPAEGDPFLVTGNVFEKNNIDGADGFGFFVAAGGNSFEKNKTKHSGLAGLHDETKDGANTYEKNHFDSVDVP